MFFIGLFTEAFRAPQKLQLADVSCVRERIAREQSAGTPVERNVGNVLLKLILNQVHRIAVFVRRGRLAQLGEQVVHVVAAVSRIVAAGGGGEGEARVGVHVEIEGHQREGVVAAFELGERVIAGFGGYDHRDADGSKLILDLVGGVRAHAGARLVVDQKVHCREGLSILVSLSVVRHLVSGAVQQRSGHQGIVFVIDRRFVGHPCADGDGRVGDGRHALIGRGDQFAAVDRIRDRFTHKVLSVVVAFEDGECAVDEQRFQLTRTRLKRERVERAGIAGSVDRARHRGVDKLQVECG